MLTGKFLISSIITNNQHFIRDFTGDDYELLSSLDDTIHKKPNHSKIEAIESLVDEKTGMDPCCICLDDFQVGVVLKTLKCKHFFHGKVN